jgi:hypothetical protein
MSQLHQPGREQVREWLRQEIALHRPPPDPTEIRRQLGWTMNGMGVARRSRKTP